MSNTTKKRLFLSYAFHAQDRLVLHEIAKDRKQVKRLYLQQSKKIYLHLNSLSCAIPIAFHAVDIVFINHRIIEQELLS